MSDLPIRLVVLFGGQSAEHDISCVTARHVLAAVDPARYEVQPIGITRTGAWVAADDAARALAEGVDHLPATLTASGTPVDALPVVAPSAAGEQVVVLPLLHGPMGEDGTVQGLLELAGVPYVGCGVLSSAVSMDKGVAKEVCAANGIPQARWHTLHADDLGPGVLDRVADDLGFPLFVKPANMGSSIGVTRATSVETLADAVDLAFSYDEWIVCEEAITGREIECAVLGTTTAPRASLPGEIVPAAAFYDFADKYRDGAATLHIPAPLSDEVTAEVQSLARRVFRVLRCHGMARVDVFYDEAGRGLVFNEVNTIPGFTPISMYPKMWEASGLSYPALIDELVALALDRHAGRRRRTDIA